LQKCQSVKTESSHLKGLYEGRGENVVRGKQPLTRVTSIYVSSSGDRGAGQAQYFGQHDNGKSLFAIYRKRREGDLLYQEAWTPATNSWEVSVYLMRLITGGDCTLAEIRIEDAREAFPEAFSAGDAG